MNRSKVERLGDYKGLEPGKLLQITARTGVGKSRLFPDLTPPIPESKHKPFVLKGRVHTISHSTLVPDYATHELRVFASLIKRDSKGRITP